MLNTATIPVIDSVLMGESPEDAEALRPLLLQMRATADREPPTPSAAVQRLLDGNAPGNVVHMGDYLARRAAKGQGRYGVKRRLAVTSVAAVLMLGAGTGVAAAMDGDLRTQLMQSVAQMEAAALRHEPPPGPPAAIDPAKVPLATGASTATPTATTILAPAPAPTTPSAAPTPSEAPATPPASIEAPEAPATADAGQGKSEDSRGVNGTQADQTGAAGAANESGNSQGNGNGYSQGNGNGNAWGRDKTDGPPTKPAPQPKHEDILGELIGKAKKAKGH